MIAVVVAVVTVAVVVVAIVVGAFVVIAVAVLEAGFVLNADHAAPYIYSFSYISARISVTRLPTDRESHQNVKDEKKEIL